MSRLIRPVALAVAGAVAVVAGWLVLGAYDVQAARQERLAQRSPIVAGGGDHVVARYGETADIVDGRQFSVVALIPVDPTAATPPGLPRWPEPGEAWLSPAVSTLDDEVLHTRFGRFGGVIGYNGLGDPNELFVYYRPADPPTAEDDRWTPVSGWGRNQPYPWVSAANDRSPANLALLVACLVGLPTLLLAALAGRVGPARHPRDRMPARVLRWGSGTVASAAAGALAAATLSWWAVRDGGTLPVTGYRFASVDFDHGVHRVALLIVGATLGVTIVAALSRVSSRLSRRLLGRPLAPRPTRDGDERPPDRGWSRQLATGGTVAVVLAAVGVPMTDWILMTACFAVLTAVPFAVRRRTAEIGEWSARLADRHQRRAASVAAGWLRTGPVPVSVFAAALLVTLTVPAFALVALTSTGGELGQALAVRSAVGYQIIRVTGAVTTAERARFIDQVGSGRVLRVVVEGRTAVLSGSCAALAQLGRSDTCPRSPTQPSQVYAELSQFGRALNALGIIAVGGLGAAVSSAEEPGELRALLVLNADGEAGYREVVRTAFAVLPLPAADLPGQEWLGAIQQSQDDAGWLRLMTLVAVVVVSAAGILGAAASISARPWPEHAATGDRRAALAVAGWALVPPLVAVSTLAATAAYVVALAARSVYGSGDIPVGVLLTAPAVTLVMAATGCLLCAVRRPLPFGALYLRYGADQR